MNQAATIRILVADDHPVVRRGLTTVIAVFDDFKLVGEANNGEEAVALCEKTQPDVILMDLVMPGMGGAKTIEIIRERFPGVAVIALTSFGEKSLVEAAVKAGAMSYLLKNVTADELAAAIRNAFSGRTTLSPEVARLLMQDIRHLPVKDYDITDREREILRLMIEGLSNTGIAERLVISQSTVKFHVSNILSKLRVDSRTEAVALALKSHLV